MRCGFSATPPQGKRPVVIAKAGAGETVGEMSLIDAGPRSATAVVTHAGPAHRLEVAGFSALRSAFHPVAYKILHQLCKELCSRLRATSKAAVAGPDSEIVPLELEMELANARGPAS